MRPQHRAFRIGRRKTAHNFGPQQSGSSHFGNFHIEIHADAPEETEPRCKIINLQSSSDRCLDIFLSIRQRVSELQSSIRARLLNMISRN